ncbi:unnamed protein product [Gordionus sp. m RMFG-2023]
MSKLLKFTIVFYLTALFLYYSSGLAHTYITRGRPFECRPYCMIYCPNGNVLDSNRCPTCQCIKDLI